MATDCTTTNNNHGQRSRAMLKIGLVGLLLWLSVIEMCDGQVLLQQNAKYRNYGREGVYVPPPNPGDTNYKTYYYNGRRYGPELYNSAHQNGRLDPRVEPYPDPERYPDVDLGPPLPGVLGGWRPDIQGKERRDSQNLPRDIYVKTGYGDVQGFKVYLYDDPNPDSLYRPWHSSVERVTGTTCVFLGIPYAMPPTGEGRFKPPRKHNGWEMMQAVDFGPACPQPIEYVGFTKGVRTMDEDCLYLNIYTPTIDDVAQNYPVMVYIHGGEFSHGASNLFPGHIMATFYNVVVVTFNYRLGALGFLSTGDDNSPGNYGILDQALALQWVHDNIEFFKGDRNSITLFGPGAGAASAGLLMVAPRSRNIITQIIAMSGSAMADWSLIHDKYRAQNTSRVFAQSVACSIDSSWKLVNCLKHGRNFYELGNAEFPPQVGLRPWAPVFDNNFTVPDYEGWNRRDWDFLTELPEESIKKRRYNRGLRYMTGVTSQEASYLIFNNKTLAPTYEVSEEFFDQKVKEFVLRYNYTLNPIGIFEAIKYMYTYWPDPKNKTHIREEYINMLSDFLYVAPVDKMVKLLVEQNVPVYMYVLNTTIEAFKYPLWRQYPHNTEHYLLSGAPFMDVEFFPEREKLDREMWTDNDRNMSHFFMKAFTDFARYGNPSQTQILGLHFEKASHGDLKYLNLNTTYNSSIYLNYRQTQAAFWTQYVPIVVGHEVATYAPTTEFWWEPAEPLQIAFWSMSAVCLFLIVLVVICCLLWRNSKRQADRYYSGEVFVHDNAEADPGIENHTRSKDNIYEYRDMPTIKSKAQLSTGPSRVGSSVSLRTNSAISLKEVQSLTNSSPNGEPRKGTPIMASKKASRSKTQLVQGVPQTDV